MAQSIDRMGARRTDEQRGALEDVEINRAMGGSTLGL